MLGSRGKSTHRVRDKPCAEASLLFFSGVIFYPLVAAIAGTRDSFSYSSSDRRREAAATFCSRCSTEEVPGMGSIMGDLCINQARAFFVGLALRVCAIWLSTSPATFPAPKGYQGIKAIPLRSQ